jgi:hypothetical protein
MTFTEAINNVLDNPLVALLLVLGAYGWWRLIARDSITDKWRFKFFLRWPHEGFVGYQTRPRRGQSVYSGGAWYTSKGTFWGELVYCPYCLGWWIALLQFLAYMLAPEFVLVLAFAHASRIVGGLLSKHG